MKKIYYCDLMATGGMHTEFNSACMQMLLLTFPKYQQIDFYGEQVHCKIVKGKMGAYNICYHPYSLLPRSLKGGIKTVLRDLIACIYVVIVFLKAKRGDLLFFALSFPFSQYCIYLCQLLFCRKTIVCQHGELEAFIKECKMSTRMKVYYRLIRPLLKSSRIVYVVLGQPIWKEVRSLFAETSSNVVVIDHPYLFSKQLNNTQLQFNPLIIGQVGCGGIGKGTQYLFSLASKLSSEISAGKLLIKLVGRLNPELYHMDEGLVIYARDTLSDADFNSGVASLHYTLQLRDRVTGKAVASGSFFDALKYEKPFIGLCNDYIDYYVKDYPKIGKSFDSIDEVAQEVRRILALKPDEQEMEYVQGIEDIRRLKSRLSVPNIASSFREQFSKLKNCFD